MIKVIGVRFRRAGKVYYFNPLDMDITTGMHVIVETARGVEYGYVVLGVKDMDEEKVFQPLKPMQLQMKTDRRKRMHLRSVRKKSQSMVLI